MEPGYYLTSDVVFYVNRSGWILHVSPVPEGVDYIRVDRLPEFARAVPLVLLEEEAVDDAARWDSLCDL